MVLAFIQNNSGLYVTFCALDLIFTLRSTLEPKANVTRQTMIMEHLIIEGHHRVTYIKKTVAFVWDQEVQNTMVFWIRMDLFLENHCVSLSEALMPRALTNVALMRCSCKATGISQDLSLQKSVLLIWRFVVLS